MKTTLLRNTLTATAALFISMSALPLAAQTQTEEAYVVQDGTTLTFYYDGNKAAHTPGTAWGIDEQKKSGVEYYPIWSGTFKEPNKTLTKVVFDDSFKSCRPTTTKKWFYNYAALQTIEGLSNLNTSNVTNMYGMFFGCSSLTALDVSGFNTSNVISTERMFNGCSSLTALDVSGFNTSNVLYMEYMFYGCRSLTALDVSGFNTSNVVNMYGMFFGCSSLTALDVSGFNTSNVRPMGYMFYGCRSLTSLDVSGFNTSGVTEMSHMFYGCHALTTIYCNDTWTCDTSRDMFSECPKLKGAVAYNMNKTDIRMANPITGYFTRKGGTAIEAPTADAPAAKRTIHTLSGVRMRGTPGQLPPGMYIVNGKKVVKK